MRRPQDTVDWVILIIWIAVILMVLGVGVSVLVNEISEGRDKRACRMSGRQVVDTRTGWYCQTPEVVPP